MLNKLNSSVKRSVYLFRKKHIFFRIFTQNRVVFLQFTYRQNINKYTGCLTFATQRTNNKHKIATFNYKKIIVFFFSLIVKTL